MAVSSQEQKLAAENLYRDANTLIYGDNKPSEEAIDRVVGKINKECVLSVRSATLLTVPNLLTSSIDKKGKFSRKRLNEEEGDITYINEHNRVFNKKVGFFFVNLPIQIAYHYCHTRLRGTTTNIHQRFGPASSAAQLCNPVFLRTGPLPLIVFYTVLLL